MPPENGTIEMLEQAVAGLADAKKSTEAGFEAMKASNERVDALLKEQTAIKEGREKDRGDFAKIQDELKNQAGRMEMIAQEHTATLDLMRKQTRLIGQQNTDGGSETGAWMYRGGRSRGTIFQSKQQAMELGMYFMATMARQNEAKAGAIRWLTEHRKDLRYLPQIPTRGKGLFEAMGGEEWLQSYVKQSEGRFSVQDLAGGVVPGSVLTSPTFADTLIRNVEEHGKFRQEALIWPMASESVRIPKRTSGISISWEGEADSIAEGDPSFILLAMTAKKMAKITQFSSELNEDAALAIADLIMFEYALAIAFEEDRIGFNGTGTGGDSPGFAGFTGVLGLTAHATAATAVTNNVPHLVTGIATNDLTTEVTLAKLREMTGKLSTWARANAKWFMDKTVHADLDGIETTGSGPVVQYREGFTASILGYPMVDVEAMPISPSSESVQVFFLGDLRKAMILGDRRSPEVQTSEHYAFNTDQLTMRVTSRVAFLVVQGDALVVYKTGSTS